MRPVQAVSENLQDRLMTAWHQARQKLSPQLDCYQVELRLVETARLHAQISVLDNAVTVELGASLLLQYDSIQTHACEPDETTHILCKFAGPFTFLPFGWLLLHELSHVLLGHFCVFDRFGVAQRGTVHRNCDALRPQLPKKFLELVPLCLEMQADHEATDTLLGSFSTDGWHDLCDKVVATSAIMMLVELEDTKRGIQGQTHPKAATRIFQLMGHVAEMPLVEAQLNQDASFIPTEDVLQAFAHKVTIPRFFDAVQLAETAGAASIADDLGSPEDFFMDLEIAKLGDPSRYADFKTQGAQEWAKLWPCNEALKPILGGHFTN